MKYSLATLLLLTSIVALGMAALVNATPLWTQLAVTSVVLVLIGATVVATHSKKSRPFISGFALAAWAYFLLTATAIGGTARDNLITSAALAKLYPVLHDDATGRQAYAFVDLDIVSVAFTGQGNSQLVGLAPQPATPLSHFSAIGHSLWSLLVGGLGGILAMVCWRRGT